MIARLRAVDRHASRNSSCRARPEVARREPAGKGKRVSMVSAQPDRNGEGSVTGTPAAVQRWLIALALIVAWALWGPASSQVAGPKDDPQILQLKMREKPQPAKGKPDANAQVQDLKSKADETPEQQGYRIDQPGTITFTVGVKIKGKVEKPQVMIFLPKERPLYRPVEFSHTFSQDLADPLPFTPMVD